MISFYFEIAAFATNKLIFGV